MNKYELNKSILSESMFSLYAQAEEDKSYLEAIVDWRNCNHKGKYIICESRAGYENGRMFIRIVNNSIVDSSTKEGWWNTFTISTKVVPVGLWLCSIDHYKTDRNGYLNVVVTPIVAVPELKFHYMFEKIDNTWNSPAIAIMVNGCGMFLPEYQIHEFRMPNMDVFYEKFPQYKDMNYRDMCKALLFDWINDKVELSAIEEAINTLNSHELLLKNIRESILRKTIEKDFSEYPLFAKKIAHPDNCKGPLLNVDPDRISDYLDRNAFTFDMYVKEGKIEPIKSNYVLDKVEALLKYRKNLKDAEKMAKKNKK